MLHRIILWYIYIYIRRRNIFKYNLKLMKKWTEEYKINYSSLKYYNYESLECFQQQQNFE